MYIITIERCTPNIYYISKLVVSVIRIKVNTWRISMQQRRRVYVYYINIMYDVNYVYYILSGNKRIVRYRLTQYPDSK